MLAFAQTDFARLHSVLRAGSFGEVESVAKRMKPSISGFESHSLLEQDRAALMDRIDSKYLLRSQVVRECLESLPNSYTVLEIDGKRMFTYENTYFDSARRYCFAEHHNGKLNRHKIRYRRYLETDTEFFEVKIKTNKRRTIKQRVLLDEKYSAAETSARFAEQILGVRSDKSLEPCLLVNYHRMTLLNRDSPERLTLDFDLRFADLDSGKEVSLGEVCILEQKRGGKLQHSGFLSFIREQHLRPTDFSKYCIGTCLTNDASLKTNRFRPTLRRLQKTMGTT